MAIIAMNKAGLGRAAEAPGNAHHPPPKRVEVPTDFAPPTDFLSARECEIAMLVAQGLSNKQIGLRLGISHWTVSAHLRHMFVKLDIGRRIELCLIVLEKRSG
jgi:DNA-binding NarL/FixJ family response regulator